MIYEEIRKANETITTTDIKGKEYAEVNQRIKAFRMVEPNGSILTEILSNSNGVVVFKASVLNGDGNILATGHAYEKEDSSFINKTSYIENCETSAVGRALGLCGFGIDTSIASYEEVKNAVINQQPKELTPLEKAKKMTLKKDDGTIVELSRLNIGQLERLLNSEDPSLEELREAAKIILESKANG